MKTVPAILALVLVSTSAQAKTWNPLVGRWSGRMGDMPILVQYRPNGTEDFVFTVMGKSQRDVVKEIESCRYKVWGDTVVTNVVGLTVGGKVMPPPSSPAPQSSRFRISHGNLTFLAPDGSVLTLKKVP